MAQPQHVLIVSEHPYPDHATVRRNVAELLDKGIAVDIVCLAGRNSAPTRPGLRVFQLAMKHKRTAVYRYLVEYVGFFAWALFVTLPLSLRNRYQAVLVDNPPDFLLLVPWLARLRGARVVLEMFELVPELTAARLRSGARHPAVRVATWIERWAWRRADEVIVVSDRCRDVIAARGADITKISVIPNSIPAPPPTASLDPTGGEEFIVTHCSLVERYGVQVAIHALALLHPQRPNLTLRVLGDGEYKTTLVALAQGLGLQDHVVFTGFVPWEQAMAEIRRARAGIVAVIADGYGELLLPTKLLEYATNGVPVACAALPAVMQAFPADSLAYFEPGDPVGLARQLEHLLSHRQGAEEQAVRARAAMRRLSWETVAPRYAAALGLSGARHEATAPA